MPDFTEGQPVRVRYMNRWEDAVFVGPAKSSGWVRIRRGRDGVEYSVDGKRVAARGGRRQNPPSERKAYSIVRRHVASIADLGTAEALDALKVLRPPPPVHTKRDVIDELEDLARARDRAARRAMRPHPKPDKPARSARYMEFVRRQPCCHCDAPPRSDPHHFGRRGVGQKTTDFGCVPLCRKCHDHVTDHNTLPGLTLHGTEVLCLRTLVTLLQRFEARR